MRPLTPRRPFPAPGSSLEPVARPEDSDTLREALHAISAIPSHLGSTIAVRRRLQPGETRADAIARFRREDQLERDRARERRRSSYGQVLPVRGAE